MSDKDRNVTDELRPFDGLTPWPQALDAALALATEIHRTETIASVNARGRIAAENVAAVVEVPNADRAAMDGYAVRSINTEATTATLRCVGRIVAGMQPSGSFLPGECVEIATGAPIPMGADAVAPIEITRRSEDWVEVDGTLQAGANISRRGEDLSRGAQVVAADTAIGVNHVSAMVAAGIARLKVWDRPTVLLAPTGDEIVEMGQALAPGQVYDSNAAGLRVLLENNGARVVPAAIVADEVKVLESLYKRSDCDLIVTIGGTSVGRRDLIAETVRRLGEVVLHGIHLKPGKPLLLGRVAGRPVVGLPGFPATCMMLGHVLIEPMIRKLGRLSVRERRTVHVRMGAEVRSPRGKTQMLTVRIDWTAPQVAMPAFKFSSAISSLSTADGWVEIPAEAERVAEGDVVEVQLFEV